ncbi:MAG: ROK family protein [Oscillospiraceae bacterium]|nr:ROK family protein [Oscillospiraceae bacterium]
MYRIGVDLGGTNIVAGVVDEDYRIIGRAKTKTKAPRPAAEIMDDIAKVVFAAAKDANISMDEVASVGMGTPGTVNKGTGVIEYANNLAFQKVPAQKMLEERIGKPIFLENDANAAALGEAVAGAGKGTKDFIAITLGTGVGGGIVIDNKLLVGMNYAAGELGHHVIVFNGEPCSCGRRGCWESYASATALVRQTKEAMKRHPESKMWEIAITLDSVNGRTSFDAMRAGDEAAKEVVDAYINYVACGIINLVNALQPEMICVGGGIGHEGENLLEPLRKAVEKERYSIYAQKQTKICPAVLGNDAGVIGAAVLES